MPPPPIILMPPMHCAITMAKNLSLKGKQKTFFFSAIAGMCQLWTDVSTVYQSTGPHWVTRD